MKNILLLVLMLFSPLLMAQSAIDTTATTVMLMNAATTSSSPNATSTKPPASIPTDEYVTDEVTLADGTKAFLKHKKNAQLPPQSNVTIDRVSKIENQTYKEPGDNSRYLYVYPITIKGTECVVVSAQYTEITLALSCNWKTK